MMKMFATLSIVVVLIFTKQGFGVYEEIEEIPTSNCVRKCEGKGRVKAECIRMCNPVPWKMCVQKCKENGFTATPTATMIDDSGRCFFL